MISDMLAHHDVSGQLWESSTHHATLKEDHILIKARDTQDAPQLIELWGSYSFPKGQLTLQEVTQSEMTPSPLLEVVDLNKVVMPLTCRIWKQGDRITPLGMSGQSKKISDILIDKKIDILEKKDQLVLVDGSEEVIWLIGHKLSDKIKLSDDTAAFLKMTWAPH